MRMVWAMNLPFMEGMRNLVRRSEGKPERRWEEHNEMNVKVLGFNGIEYFWIETIGRLLCTSNGALGSIKRGVF
jgi:hypothetical protein